MVPPLSVNLKALESRLPSTSLSRSSSPRMRGGRSSASRTGKSIPFCTASTRKSLVSSSKNDAQVDLAQLQPRAPRLEAAHVQQPVHQPRQPVRLRVHRLQRLLLLVVHLAVDAVRQQRHVAADHAQRRLDLVAGHGDELRLQPVQLAQLLRHGVERARQVAQLVRPLVGDAHVRLEVALRHRRHPAPQLPDRPQQRAREPGADDERGAPAPAPAR